MVLINLVTYPNCVRELEQTEPRAMTAPESSCFQTAFEVGWAVAVLLESTNSFLAKS